MAHYLRGVEVMRFVGGPHMAPYLRWHLYTPTSRGAEEECVSLRNWLRGAFKVAVHSARANNRPSPLGGHAVKNVTTHRKNSLGKIHGGLNKNQQLANRTTYGQERQKTSANIVVLPWAEINPSQTEINLKKSVQRWVMPKTFCTWPCKNQRLQQTKLRR